MPITLQKMVENTASISFAWGEDTVNVIYHPGKVTEAFLSQVLAFNNLDETAFNETFKSFNTELAGIIKSWDVLEEDRVFDGPFDKTGVLISNNMRMFPLNADRFPELPISFRARVALEIMQDVRPNS